MHGLATAMLQVAREAYINVLYFEQLHATNPHHPQQTKERLSHKTSLIVTSAGATTKQLSPHPHASLRH
jgi:hypothetical protein